MTISARLTELTTDVRAAVAGSALPDKALILVTNDGRDVDTMQTPAAGAIIVYPLPAIEFVAPKVQRVTWTYGIVCADPDPIIAAARVGELTELLYAARIVRWEDRATPTDFRRGDASAGVTIPGYSITHTEEHRSAS